MTDIHRKALRQIAVIGLASLAIVACSPQQGELGDEFFPHAKWEQITPTPDNMVEVVTLRHVVNFTAGDAGLSHGARSGLHDFIGRNRINADDQINVQAPGRDADRLTTGRLDTIKSEFARRGLVAADVLGAPSTGAPAVNAVEVLVTRAVTIPPDCETSQPGPAQRPEQRWGCSVNAALGMMIADPLDLVEGRDLGPGDGEQASGALRRYREDKVKELNVEATTE